MVREHLGSGRPITLRAGGLSMVPMLLPGVRITLLPRNSHRPPTPGTLVAVRLQGHLVFHLLCEVQEGSSGIRIRTRGLLADDPDPPTTPEDLLGEIGEVHLGPWPISVEGDVFRCWRALSLGIAPALRLLKRRVRPFLPPAIRERIYRRLATPFGP